jgi:hypothetical protein
LSKTVDMKALVANFTDTATTQWEVYMGAKDGIGIEETFIEIGDFGPWEDDVADMIREGYTSGQRWSLTTDIDLEEDAVAEEIARLVSEGYTSGIEPSWSIEINTVHPREAYVCIDDDEVILRVSRGDDSPAFRIDTTIEDLEADPETAGIVKNADPAPGA